MTERTDESDTGGKKMPKTSSASLDPRLVAMVRMLARRAAERDFAELVRSNARTSRGANRKERP